MDINARQIPNFDVSKPDNATLLSFMNTVVVKGAADATMTASRFQMTPTHQVVAANRFQMTPTHQAVAANQSQTTLTQRQAEAAARRFPMGIEN